MLQCHLASENYSERVKSCRDKFRYGNFCCLKTICTKNGCRVFGVRELCQCCTGRGGQIWFRDSGPATPPCSVLSAPANTQPDTDGPKHSPASSPGLCPLSSPLLKSSCHVWDVCSLQSACCMSAAGERNVGRWRAVGRNCTKPIQVSDRCFLPSQASTRPLPGLSSAPAWPPWRTRPQPLSLEGGRRQWWWCVRVEPAVDWDVGRLQCWQWRQCWAAPVYTHTVHSLPVWQAEQPSAHHQHQWQSSAGLPTRTDTKFIKCQVRRKL